MYHIDYNTREPMCVHAYTRRIQQVQGRRFTFRIGGGAKVRKVSKFSARFTRKVAKLITNFSSCRNYWGGGGGQNDMFAPQYFHGGGGGTRPPWIDASEQVL